MVLNYQTYQKRLDHALEQLRSKCMGQEVRFYVLLPGGACRNQDQYAHRVAQVLMLQVARLLPRQDEDIRRGYRWLHAAILFLLDSCPPADHTVRNLIRLAKLERSVLEQLEIPSCFGHCAAAFLQVPPHTAFSLELAAWRMADPTEVQLQRLEELLGAL